ncbi:MAG: hypothetical protein NZ601_05110 [candidate division WOR-3 bacterium]|nr:hypothetical protein [candidate division WOR-3 bacterium]MCX7757055.1 hypothetical protein [candidate division WOR-3 bacterium]MDW7987246.1 hypothetical protein [candidate division WOR-3 bacterium]
MYLAQEPLFRFQPRPFGPTFEWTAKNIIKITSGPLLNQEFILENKEREGVFDSYLYSLDPGAQTRELAHSFCEYEKNFHLTIWDVMVDRSLRKYGLAELLIKFQLRELLVRQKFSEFRIRMLQLFEPETKVEVKLKNVGIGVIAYKLGLSCEYDFSEFVKNNEIKEINVIPPAHNNPPAYQIYLKSFPYVLVAFMIDIDKEKPLTDYATYLRLKTALEFLLEMAKHRALIIGNADYILRPNGINDFISRIADNENEAQFFYNRLQLEDQANRSDRRYLL